MKIYIVIEGNGEEYPEDFEQNVGGVFSSLEKALSTKPKRVGKSTVLKFGI